MDDRSQEVTLFFIIFFFFECVLPVSLESPLFFMGRSKTS